MRITLTFNKNDSRSLETYSLLDALGRRKTAFIISCVEAIQRLYPEILTTDISSDDVVWLIRAIGLELTRGGGSSIGSIKIAPERIQKKKQKKRIAKQTAPERPKLIEPIPAEPIPETPKPVPKPAPEPEVVTRPSDSAEETNTEDTPGAILAAILSPEDLAAAKKLQSKFSQLDDDFD